MEAKNSNDDDLMKIKEKKQPLKKTKPDLYGGILPVYNSPTKSSKKFNLVKN